MKRKRPLPPPRNPDGYRSAPNGGMNGGMNNSGMNGGMNGGSPSGVLGGMNWAVVAGIFVLGIVLGVVVAYNSNFSGDQSVATEAQIDSLAPNPELCAQYGASAIVTDTRVFVTLNPRRVFVSQPQSSPGCVMRTSNWSVLEQKDVLNSEEMRSCRNRMNTFGFTGDLNTPKAAKVDCIYQNDGGGRF